MSTPRPTALDPTACLHAISSRLTDASALAKAALACAEAGADRQALAVILDLDALLHEATTLHGALRLIARLSRDQLDPDPAG